MLQCRTALRPTHALKIVEKLHEYPLKDIKSTLRNKVSPPKPPQTGQHLGGNQSRRPQGAAPAGKRLRRRKAQSCATPKKGL